MKYKPTKRTGYTLNPGIYEVADLNITLRLFLPDNVKVSVTIDYVRLKSKLKNNQTLIFTIKSFFYTIFGFTQPHRGPLNEIEGFYQKIRGSYKSDETINITGIDKLHLKADCIQGSILNGVRGLFLYSLAPTSPSGHKKFKEPRIKLFKQVNKSVFCFITN